VSKKRDLDSIEDMDESTYELLGSKLSKLATASRGKDRFRERRANDQYDSAAAAPRAKRTRDHPEH
jgi:Ser/Thr protein kinase RdoA (MazF antagonist)